MSTERTFINRTVSGGESINRLKVALNRAGLECDDSDRRLTEYSYDASNYRVRPMIVVFPKNIDEISVIAGECRNYSIPLTIRGGGTSMAGNSVGDGVVVDLSRHFTSVDPVDEQKESAWVGAGVVLSELRSVVEQSTVGRFTFAPDPSSQSRATIGGSIGNDACGNHSVQYGRMTHHFHELEFVTADGVALRVGKDFVRACDESDPFATSRAADIEQSLRQLVQKNLAIIRLELERIPRQVSGYHLGQLLPENGVHFARALAGSEGTCGIIARARVKIVTRDETTVLLCLGYPTTVDSARDVMAILESRPSALEGLDSSIVDIMRARRGIESVEGLPVGDAYLMVEFSGKSASKLTAICDRLITRLSSEQRFIDYTVVTDPAERAKLWRVREDGAGLSSRRLDGVQTWPGWEDSAVGPENLAQYLEELLPLVGEFGYSSYLYGHFGAGCVHMRLDYDLRTPEGIAKFGEFTRRAAAIVVKHGGSLSGEHGDGRARGELLHLMYSPAMLDLFAQFKTIWDPTGLLNPGIIVNPTKIDESLALAGTPNPIPGAGEERDGPFAGSSHACIGVGRCRATTHTFMCPSYRASKDEKDSTRARSRVLQEYAREHGENHSGWSSPEVRDSLDLCLTCKACSNDCPTGVDIAEAKSVLIDEHYRGRIRPFTHYSIGWLPRWLPILTRFSVVANWATHQSWVRSLADLWGVSARRKIPSFVSARMRRQKLSEAQFSADGDVVLFLDSFTKAFRPEIVPAATRVLSEAGQTAQCSSDLCCGLTWISTGQRATARRKLSRLVSRLDEPSARPIVVLEPSCAAAIRDDGPKLLGTDASQRVADRVTTFAGAVTESMKSGWVPSSIPPAEAVLQTHCHEHSVFGPASQRGALVAWGVREVVESSSCCGVAGNFGFETDHFDFSMKVSEHSIGRAMVQASLTAPILTDGFGCAIQVSQIDQARGSVHLAQLMDPQLNRIADA